MSLQLETRYRKRGKNFTARERTLFLNIISEYMHIVENKKTDGTTSKLKRETWKTIESRFNSDCQTGERTCLQLHGLFEGMKKKAKMNEANNMVELSNTDGILLPVNHITYEDAQVLKLLGGDFPQIINRSMECTDPLDLSRVTPADESDDENSTFTLHYNDLSDNDKQKSYISSSPDFFNPPISAESPVVVEVTPTIPDFTQDDFEDNYESTPDHHKKITKEDILKLKEKQYQTRAFIDNLKTTEVVQKGEILTLIVEQEKIKKDHLMSLKRLTDLKIEKSQLEIKKIKMEIEEQEKRMRN